MNVNLRALIGKLDNESVDRFGRRFVEGSAAQRTAILDDIAWPRKARAELSQGVGFFNYFRDLTASGFWSSQMGVKDVGYIGNEFVQVWDGCPPAANQRLGVSHDLMNTRIPFQRSR